MLSVGYIFQYADQKVRPWRLQYQICHYETFSFGKYHRGVDEDTKVSTYTSLPLILSSTPGSYVFTARRSYN